MTTVHLNYEGTRLETWRKVDVLNVPRVGDRVRLKPDNYHVADVLWRRRGRVAEVLITDPIPAGSTP